MEALVRYRHWQIFMLTFGILMIAFVAQVIVTSFDLFDVTIGLRFVSLIGAGTSVATACWTYIVAKKLNEKREYKGFNLQSYMTAAIMMAGVSVVHNLVVPELTAGYSQESNLLLNLATLGLGVYLDYWLAKLLRSTELNRDVLEFPTGDFFALLFLPIGIWWIQPRINKIFEGEDGAYDPDAPLDHNIR